MSTRDTHSQLGPAGARPGAPLTLGRKIMYSVVQLGNGSIDFIIAVYLLKFYTDYAGLAPELAGYALLLGKAFDAVTDPLMGNVTDRTQTRWGRRRPWFLVGVIPLGLSFIAMFSPNSAWSQTSLFLWLTVTNALFYAGSTILDVPHAALGSEMVHDHRERVSLMGWRQAFSSIGLLVGAASPGLWLSVREKAATAAAAAAGKLEEAAERAGHAAYREAHAEVALLFGAILLVTVIVSFLGTRENPAQQTPPRATLLGNFTDTLRSKLFIFFLSIFIIEQVGTRFTISLALYAFNDWWGFDKSYNSALLLTYLGVGLLSIPFWVRISGNYDKGHMFLAGSAVTVLALCLMLFVPAIGPGWGFAMLALAGTGFGARNIMAIAMMGDVIDEDEYRTHSRKDGQYFGQWMFARKMTQALTLGLIGQGLALVGYVEGGAEQPASAIEGIKWMFTIMPAVLLGGSGLMFLWFPLTRKAHALIVTELTRRREEAAAS